MLELDRRLEEIASHSELQSLIIISGKANNFIAGAKISEIENLTDTAEGAEKAAMGQAVFGKISNLPMTTIAAINGACVGGGLELALACDFRIARQSKATRIGLPEVRLGIIPGFGGTQRLPRLIGIQRALDYILTGRTVEAKRAYRSGIIDRVVPEEFDVDMMPTVARAFAIEVRSPEIRQKLLARRQRVNAQSLLLEKNFIGRKVLFDQARKRVLKESKGQYPAPLLALESVEKGFPLELEAGLAIEAELLGRAVVTQESKNLIKIFYLTEEIKKDPGVVGFDRPVTTFHRIGVLGAGVMGGGIAQLMAFHDLPTRMKDINYAAVARGTETAARVFGEAVKKRRMTRKEMQNKMARISGTTDYSGFHRVDLVIEAIVENLDLKKRVFAEIDNIVPPHAVLASNTSSLSITEMAKATRRPDKVCGLHFFNPVHRMPLVRSFAVSQPAMTPSPVWLLSRNSSGKRQLSLRTHQGFLSIESWASIWPRRPGFWKRAPPLSRWTRLCRSLACRWDRFSCWMKSVWMLRLKCLTFCRRLLASAWLPPAPWKDSLRTVASARSPARVSIFTHGTTERWTQRFMVWPAARPNPEANSTRAKHRTGAFCS